MKKQILFQTVQVIESYVSHPSRIKQNLNIATKICCWTHPTFKNLKFHLTQDLYIFR